MYYRDRHRNFAGMKVRSWMINFIALSIWIKGVDLLFQHDKAPSGPGVGNCLNWMINFIALSIWINFIALSIWIKGVDLLFQHDKAPSGPGVGNYFV